MKKRLFSLLLIITLVVPLLTVLAPSAAADVTFGPYTTGNMTWSVVIPTGSSTGTLTINRRSGVTANVPIPNYSTSSRPPWYSHSAQVDNVVLGAGITEIGNFAFADFGNLEEVAIPGIVTWIGNDAFRGCGNLVEFKTAPGGAGSWYTFNRLTIGSSAFYNCYSLMGLYTNNIVSVGAEAFVGCRSLTNISIDTSTTERIRLVGGVTNGIVVEVNSTGQIIRVIKSTVGLQNNAPGPGTPGDYTIPQTVGTATLANPPAVMSIDAEAFAYCDNLINVTIPSNVTTIGNRAFAYNSSLETATFLGDAPTSFGSNVFYGAEDSFKIIFYPHAQRWTAPRWQGYRSEVNNSRLVLDKYVIVMEKGATAEILATAQPATASQVMSWSSDNAAVATVTGSTTNRSIGIVRGIDAGTALIEVQGEDSTAVAYCTVIVLESGTSATVVLLDQSRIQARLPSLLDDPPPPPPVLTAYIYPYPTDAAARDQMIRDLIWTSSDPSVAVVSTEAPASLDREIILRRAGTTTITVRTPDGRSSATCVVVVEAATTFVPVTDITLSTTTIAMGATINLNDQSTVRPSNATYWIKTDWDWGIVTNQSTITNATLAGSNLTVPWGQTGTVAVRVTVPKGRADVDWGYNENLEFTKIFTINVVQFLPVTGIIEVPTIAFAGVPLQMRGTVLPAGASYRAIEWTMEPDNLNTAGARFDPATGILTPQWPGTVSMKATVRNGLMSTASAATTTYEQFFIIKVDPYITNALDLRANPGGSVSGAGIGQFAGGEVVTITATPSAGYVFAGWYSSNGGDFADASRATTQFTMPGNATMVVAYFTYIGLPGGTPGSAGSWSGGVILPTPVHYFTNNSIYTRNSSVTFGHVTLRDFQLFSYVTLDGRTLSRNAHYTANRSGGYTEIILANGYLNALEQGAHTLMVFFSDYVSVTAVFTVVVAAQTSQEYDDVYTSDWFYNSVSYVSSRGWMTARASEPRRFRPSDTVTQGEVIDALYRMAGSPTIMNQYGQALQGRDAAFEWVRSNGILPLGGFYELNSSITRQDIAVIFSRLVSVLRMRYPVVRAAISFADEWQIDPNARTAVNDIYRAGVMGGRTANTFVPLGYVTRAEYAAVLHRFAEAMGRW